MRILAVVILGAVCGGVAFGQPAATADLSALGMQAEQGSGATVAGLPAYNVKVTGPGWDGRTFTVRPDAAPALMARVEPFGAGLPRAKAEPIPTQWPNAKFEPIPTRWAHVKVEPIGARDARGAGADGVPGRR